jgi:large subunit ribosomal protein L31e
VKKFAQKVMKTSDVRVDVKLNKHIWSKGIRNVRSRVDAPSPRGIRR